MAMEVVRTIRESRGLVIALWVAVIMFVIAAALQFQPLIMRMIPPYTVVSAQTVTPRIHAGEPFVIAYHIIRRRLCKVDLDRFIADSSGNVLWRDRVPGGAIPVGNWPRVLNTLQAPESFQPGIYTVNITVINECLEGMHVTGTPISEFEIIP